MTKAPIILSTLTTCVAITATSAWLGWREFIAEPEFGGIIGMGYLFFGLGASIVIAFIAGLVLLLKGRAHSSATNLKTHSDPR